MTKQIKQKDTTQDVQVNRRSEAIEMLIAAGVNVCTDSDEWLITSRIKRFLKDHPDLSKLTGDEKEKLKKYGKSVRAMDNLNTNFALTNSLTSNEFRIVGNSLCKELITEYNCQTASERATAQVVANAYVRIMKFSLRFDSVTTTDSTTRERNGFASMISKELDRAERHYLMALNTLRQLKQPTMKVNIKTNNAFVAEKQQLNYNQASDEKIKSI